MTHASTALADYRPIGGALCLDFANTVDWHDSDHPVELLTGSDQLSTWSGMVAGSAPDARDSDLTRAIELRDAVWEAFRAVLRADAVPAPAVAILNQNLELAPEHRRLVAAGAGVGWSEPSVRPVDALLAGIARSAADLLTDPDRLRRVRMCAGEGCGWLFVDDSRGARRRWCSMQGCGNRAKARAHYRRKHN